MGTMTTWRARARGLVAGAVALVCATALGACTDAEPEQPATDPTFSVEPRTIPEGAEDRDADTIAQAVANIDPCALLDPEVTAARSAGPAPATERGLYSCAATDLAQVELYTPFDAWARFWQAPTTVGGAVAYRNSPLLDRCEISIPVSFTHAITFQDASSDGYDCQVVEEYAAAAAGMLLADPSAAQRPDVRDAVIACDVLEQAIGAAPDGASLRPDDYDTTPLDSCGVWDDPSEQGFVPVWPRSRLQLSYDRPIAEQTAGGQAQDYEHRTIAGTETVQWPAGELCEYRWEAWAAANTESSGAVIVAGAAAETCDEAAELAEAAIPLLTDAAPPTPAVEAILYAKGEPDTPAVGACVDAMNQDARECAPAVGAEVPDEPATFVSLGELDPNVVCEAATAIVRDVLDQELAPVTLLADPQADPRLICELVHPDHSLVVRVSTSTGTLDGFYFDETEIAGHTAVRYTETDDTRTTWVAVGDPAEPGMLELTMTVLPDRTEGTFDGAAVDHTPLDQYDTLLEHLVTDLLE